MEQVNLWLSSSVRFKEALSQHAPETETSGEGKTEMLEKFLLILLARIYLEL